VAHGGARRAVLNERPARPKEGFDLRLGIGVVIATTANAFEAVAVVTALPEISDALDGDALYGATFATYMLANLVAIIATGELADRRGPFVPFLVGAVLFSAGLVVSGLAPTMAVLVIGRALQGLGGGALYGVSYAAIGKGFSSDHQPRVFAWLSSAWVLPAVLGPLVAGVVVEHLSWRWVFLGLLPLVPVLLVLAGPALRRLAAETPVATAGVEADRRQPSRLMPALTLAAGVGLLVVSLPSDRPVVAVGGTVVGLAVSWRPLRQLFPAGFVVAAPGLAAIVVVRLLVNYGFFTVDSTIPLAADRIHGSSALVAGLLLAGGSLAWTVATTIHSRRAHQWPAQSTVAAGFGCVAVGAVITLPMLLSSVTPWLAFGTWAVAGFGIGLVFNTTSVRAMAAAPHGGEGVVGSQLQMADALGFAVGGAVSGAFVASADRVDGSVQVPLAMVWITAAVIAVLGAAVALRRLR
jgi:MFS family permease